MSQNSWIQKIKNTKLKKSKIKSCSLTARDDDDNKSIKNMSLTSNSSTNQLIDYSPAFFLSNECLPISNSAKEESLNEFDLNNNDLTYSSLCFDSIDLTNNKPASPEINSVCNSSKFVNLNHNADLYQRSNSVPLKNFDSMFNSNCKSLTPSFIENSSNDLNNIDLNYSSLYFEAIDLCLPNTSNLLHHSNSTSFDNSANFISNGYEGAKFINLNHNPELNLRSNSVPLNNMNTKNSVFDLASCIVSESSKVNINSNNEDIHLDETAKNLLLEAPLNENSESVIITSNLTTASNSPTKSLKKKSKIKQPNGSCQIDQKTNKEMNEITNDGVDLVNL